MRKDAGGKVYPSEISGAGAGRGKVMGHNGSTWGPVNPAGLVLLGWEIISLTFPGATSNNTLISATGATSTDSAGTPGISLSSGQLNYCNDSLNSIYALDAQLSAVPVANAVGSDVHQVEFGDGVILGTVQTMIGTSGGRLAFVGENRLTSPSGLYAPTLAVTCTGGTNRTYTFTCNLFVMRYAVP